MNIKTKKIAVLASMFVFGVAFPLQSSTSLIFTLVFASILFLAGLFTPFSIQYNSLLNHFVIKAPKWSDHFSHKAPLTYSHFFGFLFLSGGIGEMLGQLISMQTVSFFGSGLIALGTGMLIGNLLALKFPFAANSPK